MGNKSAYHPKETAPLFRETGIEQHYSAADHYLAEYAFEVQGSERKAILLGVFENDVSFSIDLFGHSRKKAALFAGLVITLGSIPCALGFNVWSAFEPLKAGNCIMDLEDFFVSNLVLPIGSLVCCLFCTMKYGWGFDNYLEEVNTGTGLKVSPKLKFYFKYILPCIVAVIVVYGLISYFR